MTDTRDLGQHGHKSKRKMKANGVVKIMGGEKRRGGSEMSKLSSQGVEYFPFSRHSSSSLHLGFCSKVVSSETPS